MKKIINHMKKTNPLKNQYLFLLSLFFLTIKVTAQQEGFVFQYTNEEQDLCGVESLELDGVGYIIAAFNFHHEWGSYNDTTPAQLLLVSTDGELIGSQTLSEGRRSTIVGLYAAPEAPDLFYAVGKVRDQSNLFDKPYLAKFDRNLNILFFNEIELPEQVPYFFMGNSIMDSYGDIVYFTIPYNNPNGPSTNGRIYMRIGRENGLVAYFHDDVSYVGEFDEGTLCETGDGSGDYLHLLRTRDNGNRVVIRRMNRDFNLLDTYEFEPVKYYYNDGTGDGSTTLYNDQYWTMLAADSDSLLVSIEVLGPAQHGMPVESAILYKTDFCGNAAPIQVNPNDWTFTAPSGMLLLGFPNDSIEVPARMKSFDISPADGDLIHCNGIYHAYGSNCRFTVTKADTSLETVRWMHTFDLGLFVEPMFVLATHDEGCLITGYSHNPGEERRNLFAMKLNNNGFLQVKGHEIIITPYRSSPNPVTDWLHMEYSPDVTPYLAELYNLQGQLISIQNNSLESINMKNLPPGIYTLHIILEDGTSYSDKVVKQ